MRRSAFPMGTLVRNCLSELSQWGHSSGIAYQKPLPPVQIRGQVDGKTKGKS